MAAHTTPEQNKGNHTTTTTSNGNNNNTNNNTDTNTNTKSEENQRHFKPPARPPLPSDATDASEGQTGATTMTMTRAAAGAEAEAAEAGSAAVAMPQFPAALAGLSAAEAMHLAIQRGGVVDTHRFLRYLTKLSLGLSTRVGSKLENAVNQLFAVVEWMALLRVTLDCNLWVDRAYSALIVIFHRRGFYQAAMKAYKAILANGGDVVCSTLSMLLDLALREGDLTAFESLTEEVLRQSDASSQLEPPQGKGYCSGVGEKTSTIATDGLHSWISAKDGHLIALLAGHGAALGGFSAPNPSASYGLCAASGGDGCGGDCGEKEKDEGEEGQATSNSIAARGIFLPAARSELGLVTMRKAPAILRSGTQTILNAIASNEGTAGPPEGLRKRTEQACRFLLRPCLHLLELSPEQEGLREELEAAVEKLEEALQEASTIENTAKVSTPSISTPAPDVFTAKEIQLELQSNLVVDMDAQSVPTVTGSEASEAAAAVLSVLRSLNGRRRATLEDFDELLRNMGRRKSLRPGVVLGAFHAIIALAVYGTSPLTAALAESGEAAIAANHVEDGDEEAGADDNNDEKNGKAKLNGQEEKGDDMEDGDEDDEDEDGSAKTRKQRGRRLGSWNAGDEEEDDEVGNRKESAAEDGTASTTAPSTSAPSQPSLAALKSLALGPDPHLLPDCDTYAVAIEAAYALPGAGGAAIAEHLYEECCRHCVPNPSVFSAVIFGRIRAKDGPGSAQALYDMDEAGFVPHHRFLHRVLRYMGLFHEEGLQVIRRLGQGKAQSRLRLYHALMEGCMDSGADAIARALSVHAALTEDDLTPTAETHFALIKAAMGQPSLLEAQRARQKLQEGGYLPQHPIFEPLLQECFLLLKRRKSAWMYMDTRRAWYRAVMEAATPEALKNWGWQPLPEASASDEEALVDPERCLRTFEGYYKLLPAPVAGLLACQYVTWRYIEVRSAVERGRLQSDLNLLLAGGCTEGADPFCFAMELICNISLMELCESAQLRVVRTLFEATSKCAGATWRPEHAKMVEDRADDMLPDVVSEVVLRAPSPRPFESDEGREKLLRLVKGRYLGHDKEAYGGEPPKFSTAVRFIRAHGLVPYLSDDDLLVQVLTTFVEGFPQHAYRLCEDDPEVQCRLVALALRKGERRVAGKLSERFGFASSDGGAVPAPAGWAPEEFAKVCREVVKEAEEAEEKELRDANAKRIASNDDTGCLQLPEKVASSLLLVDSLEGLHTAFERLREEFRGLELNANPGVANSGEEAIPDVKELLSKGHCIGLDVEWRPGLEKRGGMQKHRRSGKVGRLEPCSTLQAATPNCAFVFDLLALAVEDSESIKVLSDLIASLFLQRGILKLGYGFQNDLQRLAASYPSMHCFRRVEAVLDVQEAHMRQADSKGTLGLSSSCKKVFGKPLSKRLQTSDWGARPLSGEQIHYAALDAYCLIGLAAVLETQHYEVSTLQVQYSPSGQLLVQTLVNGVRERTDMEELARLDAAILAKGLEIRNLKQTGESKEVWQGEVALLLQLKEKFKALSGTVWAPPTTTE